MSEPKSRPDAEPEPTGNEFDPAPATRLSADQQLRVKALELAVQMGGPSKSVRAKVAEADDFLAYMRDGQAPTV